MTENKVSFERDEGCLGVLSLLRFFPESSFCIGNCLFSRVSAHLKLM